MEYHGPQRGLSEEKTRDRGQRFQGSQNRTQEPVAPNRHGPFFLKPNLEPDFPPKPFSSGTYDKVGTVSFL